MKKTALHENHLKMNAKMGEFAGYDMPLYYDKGVIAEHTQVREAAGLFDVSHMGQVTFEGDYIPKFLQKITPSYFEKVKQGTAKYTVLTNEEGGIIDDLIITNMGDNKFFAVINAGCKDKDIAWFEKHLPENIKMKVLTERSLLALQGPKAENALSTILNVDLSTLNYMKAIEINGTQYGDLLISRLGYTGEDGFEISVMSNDAPKLWDDLCTHENVAPIGLAARDSLRLEMGYPLYGHDIDATTSPIEADLNWVVSKNNSDFFGAKRILEEKQNGTTRKRVGFKLLDRGVAREGAEIFCQDGKKLGVVTSGGHSPILNASIGMALVSEYAFECDTGIYVRVRERNLSARVTNLPFIEPKTKNTKKDKAA